MKQANDSKRKASEPVGPVEQADSPYSQTPFWRLPPGVSRGTWEYAHTDSVANDYDEYFGFDDAFEFDVQVVRRALARGRQGEGGLIADLGTGTARALIPLMREGYRGLGIDLSQRMLELAFEKSRQEGLPFQAVRANLVELDGISDAAVDFAICLFSTLGMIRGKKHRAKALAHARRILRPEGVFVLHVHNYWFNLFDPGGPRWLLANWFRAWWDKDIERGDKYYPYRQVSRMFLHVFSRGELSRSLRRAGFKDLKFISLNQSRNGELRWPWLLGRIRASGWIIECR